MFMSASKRSLRSLHSLQYLQPLRLPSKPAYLLSSSSNGRCCRYYSPFSSDKPAKLYTYKDLLPIINGQQPNTQLIDVREPKSFAQGHIPTSINIPYMSSPGALGLDEEVFLETFGVVKPALDSELVFYCGGGGPAADDGAHEGADQAAATSVAGMSSTAEELAGTFGYQKRGDYKGEFFFFFFFAVIDFMISNSWIVDLQYILQLIIIMIARDIDC